MQISILLFRFKLSRAFDPNYGTEYRNSSGTFFDYNRKYNRGINLLIELHHVQVPKYLYTIA